MTLDVIPQNLLQAIEGCLKDGFMLFKDILKILSFRML
jgi:hypothetical protein